MGDYVRRSKVILCTILAALVLAFFVFDLRQYVALEFFHSRRDAIMSYVAAAPLLTSALFFGIYVAVTGLSVPGAFVLTIIAGALFGLVWGTVLVSFASSIGATLAFLTSRVLLRDWVQRKLSGRLAAINTGVEKEGAYYLFALRLAPVFPFFVINLAMGLTPMRVRTFYWVSQLGMLPGTIVYIYAGTQLRQFELSWQLAFALILLGIFPLAAKRAVEAFKSRRAYARME
jgi:uncharacterized membrane protein YdjX (TVP38/TMEM64 family)